MFGKHVREVNSRGERVFYLDFIRAISICLIIIYHYNLLTLELKVSNTAVLWGGTVPGVVGVSLFIILSGASLMLSTQADFNIKTYFRKRFLSIYPLFWVAYTTTFLTVFLVHQELPVSANPLTFFLTIAGLDGFLLYAIPNFYMMGEWFLGFIIIMYLFFPFLRYLFMKGALLTLLLCFCTTLLVARFYNFDMLIDRFPLARLMEFALGMSFIYLFRTGRTLLNFIILGISGLLFSLALTLNLPLPFNWTMQGMSLFICLACVAGSFDNLLFAGVIRFISRYSYGAFLMHHVVFYEILPILKDRQLSTYNDYLLFLILLIFIYSLSFLLTGATAFGLRKLADYKAVPSLV